MLHSRRTRRCLVSMLTSALVLSLLFTPSMTMAEPSETTSPPTTTEKLEACLEILIPCIEYAQQLEILANELAKENTALNEANALLSSENQSNNLLTGWQSTVAFSAMGVLLGIALGVGISVAF